MLPVIYSDEFLEHETGVLIQKPERLRATASEHLPSLITWNGDCYPVEETRVGASIEQFTRNNTSKPSSV